MVPPANGSFVESATVIFAEPSKLTPLIVRAVCSVVAVAALPVVFWLNVGHVCPAANVIAPVIVPPDLAKYGVKSTVAQEAVVPFVVKNLPELPVWDGNQMVFGSVASISTVPFTACARRTKAIA
jgi:hypothetical protein